MRYLGIGVGASNLVVESLHASAAELHAFLQEALSMDGIVSSETMQVVKIKKSIWDWDIRTEPEPARERQPLATDGAASDDTDTPTSDPASRPRRP